MRKEAIFLNGVYENVLKNILEIQEHLPEQILYLQPYSSERIVHLAENPPSVDDPVRLMISVTDDLSHVKYICEIVGWDDKRQLDGKKFDVLCRIIYGLQWPEEGVYKKPPNSDKECVNLLYVRRLIKLAKPIYVRELFNSTTNEALSPNRTTAGGWIYIFNSANDWLDSYK